MAIMAAVLKIVLALNFIGSITANCRYIKTVRERPGSATITTSALPRHQKEEETAKKKKKKKKKKQAQIEQTYEKHWD